MSFETKHPNKFVPIEDYKNPADVKNKINEMVAEAITANNAE